MKVLILTPSYDGLGLLEQRWPLYSSLRQLERAGHTFLGYGTVRGLLDDARNRLMLGALEQEAADVAIWLDDDIVWKREGLLAELVDATAAAPLVAVNGPRQDGRPCALLKNGAFADFSYRGEVARAGLGLAAADLRWYRDNWPGPPWFQTVARCSPGGTLLTPLGEDYFHSDGVWSRGGAVQSVAAWLRNGDAEPGIPAPWQSREGVL